MREELINKIEQDNNVVFVNKKEITYKKYEDNLEYTSIMIEWDSEDISSEYNLSGIGGYGINLI